jgi:uncharacterized integral membrane protein (TIGR00697 family)
VSISGDNGEIHGRKAADRLVRLGFAPLVAAILLTLFVLQLPTDKGMYPPAIEAFPIILGQSWRMMLAGIIAYGVSVTLNVYIFSKLAERGGRLVAVRAAIASALSQIVDTLIFITISFYGEREIASLILGQALAKVVLSFVMVPLVILALVALGRRLDGQQGA